MKPKKILTSALAFATALLMLSIEPLALSAPVGTITSETYRTTESITLSDGTDTGVRYTEIGLSGSAYGTNKVLRLAECDLSNTKLSIDVINCGSAVVNTCTVASAAATHSQNGKTVLAALNGDLWMTYVNSNSNVTKKTLQTTRGVMIIDREVWATQEFGMENYMNTSNPGTVASLKSAFGVTADNQPVVGAPVFTLTVNNKTKNTSLTADGLNRLPAWDSLVVYNHRVNSANYALDDSYEILLQADSTAFTVDNKVNATVTAIYPSGSTTRPTIGANTIVLTARGSRMEELSSVYTVGDKVSFDLSVVDEYGRTEMWQNVVDAIGGHMQVIVDDERRFYDTSSSEYPTSLIGIKDDGTVMFANINSAYNNTYRGLRFKDAYSLCRELGYNSVFYLDGGGSSSIVTLEDGTYTQRNYSADGSPRAVVNCVAMVWNDTPVCEKQGSLAYLTTNEEFGLISPVFMPAGVVNKIKSSPNNIKPYYYEDEALLRLNVKKGSSDPFINLNMSKFSESIDTGTYRFVTLKLKTNITSPTQFALYYTTDTQTGIQSYAVDVYPSRDYVYLTFNMAQSSGWTGNLTSLRLDLFENASAAADSYVDVSYIAFSKVPMEVNLLKSGAYPVGTFKDYYAYKDCNGEHSFTVFTQNDSDTHVAECESCGYSKTEAHKKALKNLVNPTCTSQGVAEYRCKGCNVLMEAITIPAMGHNFSDEFTVDIEPTQGGEGLKSRHCLNAGCSETTDQTVIPALLLVGDINGDGVLNSLDSNALSRELAGLSPTLAGDPDVNGDSKVNALDSQILKRIILGILKP